MSISTTQNPVSAQVGQPNVVAAAMTPAPTVQAMPAVQVTPVVQVAPMVQASHGPIAPNTLIFRKKTAASVTQTAAPVLTGGVVNAISAADNLCSSYDNLKTTVLDRSDRALWIYLQDIYAYVEAIKGTAVEGDICNELIRKITLRGGPNTTPSLGIGAVVVRYIFADASRQTWSNYSVAMKKASALGVTTDTFAAFLEQYGGVSKVVETIFDYEHKQLTFNANTSKMIREDKQSRTELMGRLYNVMAHATTNQIDYSDELSNWVPEKPKKAVKADGKEEKVDPKYQQGNFVLFVTVRDPETGKYRVVQGNVFDRAFEAQLLGTIADRMDAGTDELANVVAGLEQQIGFKSAV